MSIIVLLLFAAFGVVCGVYLSVVGFAVTTVVIFGALALLSAVGGGVMTPLALLVAFVFEQIGFFLAVVGLALREAHRRRQAPEKPVKAAVTVEPE